MLPRHLPNGRLHVGCGMTYGPLRSVMPFPEDVAHMISMTQPWKTKDERCVIPHFVLQHLADRVLGVLKCESTPESVSAAVASWNSDELEDAIAEARGCGGKIRSQQEWLNHLSGFQYLFGTAGGGNQKSWREYAGKVSCRRPSLVRRACARLDANFGRSDWWTLARRARGGRADGHGGKTSADARACPRHQPRQAQLFSGFHS